MLHCVIVPIIIHPMFARQLVDGEAAFFIEDDHVFALAHSSRAHQTIHDVCYLARKTLDGALLRHHSHTLLAKIWQLHAVYYLVANSCL